MSEEVLAMNRAVKVQLSNEQREMLISTFGDRLQRFVSLSRYAAARIGGAADWLIIVESVDQLIELGWYWDYVERIKDNHEAFKKELRKINKAGLTYEER